MFNLSNVNLRLRFAILLGGIALISCASFFVFARYSLNATEHEFEKRSRVLAQTLAAQSVFQMLMQDTQGLEEDLQRIVARNMAMAGAYFTPDSTTLVQLRLDSLLTPAAQRRVLQQGQAHLTSRQGTALLVAAAPVRRTNDEGQTETLGTAMVVVSAKNLAQQRQASLLQALVMLGLIGLSAGFVYWKIGQTITVPVRRLNRAAAAVEQGDLDVRVDVDQNDEIGELADAFNAMVAANAHNIQALDAQRNEAEAALDRAERLQQEADDERRYLQTQFDRISAVIEAVTDGDLTQRLTVEHDDAVGHLMRQINGMIGDLHGILRDVHGASNDLSAAAQVVASSADQMARGAQEQAEQTTTVAAAIEEMSSTIETTSERAHDSNEMVQHASQRGSDGEAVFEETARGMHRIAKFVRASADQMTELGASSQEIGEIIGVISEIADQTNLLALNAAIEAARAGEHGKGFAVVADEVRQLAERTANATAEVGEMIGRIQDNTERVVTSMERGEAEVETGLELVDDAATALREIVGSIGQMESEIEQIARASEQQAVASGEIAQNVDAISSVADEVSHSTTDLVKMADDMSQQAETLRQIVDRFNIGHAASTPSETTSLHPTPASAG